MRRYILSFFMILIHVVYASVYLNTARIAYFNEQDYARARRACLTGIEQGEIDFELYAILAGCEIAYGNWGKAANALFEAIKVDSAKTFEWMDKKGGGLKYYHQAFYFSARALFLENENEEALERIDYARFLHGSDINTVILRGAILYKLGKIEEANREYSNVLAIDPRNPDVHFLIGKALFEIDEFDSSLVYFNNALDFYNPRYERTLYVLFQNASESNIDIAMEILALWRDRKIHELDQILKAELALDNGLIAHSETISKLDRTATDLARAYYYAGLSYYHIKEDSLALDNLRACLKLKSDDTDALFYAGEILVKFKAYDQAVVYLDKAAHLNPDDQYAWFYLGVCYTKLKEYDKAIGVYEKMLGSNPERIDVLTNLAYLYSELGAYVKSNEYLRKAELIQKKPQ